MFKPALFIGVSVDQSLETAAIKQNPHAIEIFVKNGSDYLHEFECSSGRYWGKQLSGQTPLSQLDLLSANVQSLLFKLVPGYSESDYPVTLVGFVDTDV